MLGFFGLRSEEPKEPCVTMADTDREVLFSVCNSNTEDSQPEGKTSRIIEYIVPNTLVLI